MSSFFEYLKKIIANIKRGMFQLRFFRWIDFAKVWKKFGRKEKWLAAILCLVIVGDFVFILSQWYVHHTIITPERGGTYTEGVLGEPRYINPLLAQTETDKDLSVLSYSGLYKYDDQGNLVPDLASAMPIVSSNQKQFTISLKPGLKWQDDQSITADDVVFTIQTIQNPAYQSPLLKNWENTTVKKINDTTVEFDNADISAPFVSNFTLGILPEHLWKSVNPVNFSESSLNLEPIGSGPFIAKEIVKDSSGNIKSYKFESFSGYAGGQPMLAGLQINFYPDQDSALLALHSKQIQGFGYTPHDQEAHFASTTNLSINLIPTYTYLAVFFNTNGSAKALGDSTVRAALTQATDRQEITSQEYSGDSQPAYGPFAPQQLGYNSSIESINPFNISAANTALDKAGWTKNPSTGMRSKNGVKLAFTITTNSFVLNDQTALDLKNQWAKIGADISVKTLSTTDLAAAITGRSYDAILFSENTGFDPDPFVFWHSSQALNPGLNLSEYKNTTADKLMVAGRNTLDPKVRTKNYEQFQSILLGDAPAVFLVRPDFVYALSSNVKGMDINQLANPEDRFYDIGHWYVKTKRVWK